MEDYIEQKLKGKVGTVECVGVHHEIFTEGIMAFVEKVKDADIAVEDLNAVCSGEDGIAAYKRPSHFEILEPGEIPLNRIAKTDYMELKRRGKEIAARLRAEDGWDS